MAQVGTSHNEINHFEARPSTAIEKNLSVIQLHSHVVSHKIRNCMILLSQWSRGYVHAAFTDKPAGVGDLNPRCKLCQAGGIHLQFRLQLIGGKGGVEKIWAKVPIQDLHTSLTHCSFARAHHAF